MGNTWSLETKTPQEGTAAWSGVCLLINLVFSSTDSGGGAQKGIEQGGKVTTTVRRMDLEPGRGGQKASDGERLRRSMLCFLIKRVCSLTGKAHSDQLTQN